MKLSIIPKCAARPRIYHVECDGRIDLQRVKPHAKNVSMYDRLSSRGSWGSNWWGGLRTEEQVARMCRDGWRQGSQTFDRLFADLTGDLPIVPQPRRKRVRSDIGDELDIHAAWSGRVDRAWSATNRSESPGLMRRAEVWLQPGCGIGVSQDDQIWGMVAAVALAEHLHRQRVAVMIRTADLTERREGSWILVTATVKLPTMPLNRQELITVCHVAYTRLYQYRAMLAAPVKVSVSMGAAGDAARHLPPATCSRYIVPKYCYDEASAKSWLSKVTTQGEA